MANTQQVQNMLYDIISSYEPMEIEPRRVEGVKTFKEAGIVTSFNGLVITLNDGSEFQVEIVQSK